MQGENKKDTNNINRQDEAATKKEGAAGAETNLDNGSAIDVNKLPLRDVRILAAALIEENTQMERRCSELESDAAALKAKAEKAAQLSTMYNSLSRDFEAYRKRNSEIECKSFENAVAEVALNMVPVLENLKLACDATEAGSAKDGIALIVKQFEDALERLDVVPIEAVGEKFDPFRHSAVMAEEAPEPMLSGTVKAQFSGGYCYKDRVIKQSQVIVYK